MNKLNINFMLLERYYQDYDDTYRRRKFKFFYVFLKKREIGVISPDLYFKQYLYKISFDLCYFKYSQDFP